MVFVIWSSPNHTPIKHRCPIKKRNRTTPGYLQQPPCSVSFRCMLGGSVEVWTNNILPMFIEGQTHFWIIKRTWNEFNPQQTSQKRLLFIEIHTLPPSMPYKKWKEISDLVRKTTNGNSQGTYSQRKVPFELKDNSKHSICLAYPLFFYLHFTRSPWWHAFWYLSNMGRFAVFGEGQVTELWTEEACAFWASQEWEWWHGSRDSEGIGGPDWSEGGGGSICDGPLVRESEEILLVF